LNHVYIWIKIYIWVDLLLDYYYKQCLYQVWACFGLKLDGTSFINVYGK